VAVQLYMDVHVPQAITEQLRCRGINELTAIEDGSEELPDDELLERSRLLGRVIFTIFVSKQWQKTGKVKVDNSQA
jgi:Domain of unknown function (DUF5615)